MEKKLDLLPPSNDYVFSRLFGKKSHERVLTCLLNAILDGKPYINSVKLEPTEYKKSTPDGKSIRLDIAAVADDGTILNVEIQCKNEGNVEDRAAFYKAKLRQGSLKEGQSYSSIPDIVSIWICTEPETNRKGCYHEIVDMYKDNGIDPIEIASEKMRHFIIELTKLEATPKRFLNDMFSIWMKFIKDPTSIPEEFLKIPEVKEAMDELTYMSADPETRAVYDARVKELNDIYSGMTTKYNEGLEAGRTEGEKIGIEKGEKIGIEKGEKIGIEKGKAEGLEEGEKKAKIETARKMLIKGLIVEDVAEFTGLSIEEIEALKL